MTPQKGLRADKGDKGNKHHAGGKNKAEPVTVPGVVQPKSIVPILQFPTAESALNFMPVVETKKWCFANNIPALTSNSPVPLFTLNQGDVVVIKQQHIRVPGSDSSWSEVASNGNTGWVNEVFLDDYVEEFPPNEVKIPHPTNDPNDAQQFMMWGGIEQVNMCGELCAAYVVRNDIELVLNTWKNSKVKGSFSYNEGTIRKGLYAPHLKNILQAYGYTNAGDIFDLDAGVKEHSLDPDCMTEMMKSHYLVARIKSNVDHAGELLAVDQSIAKG